MKLLSKVYIGMSSSLKISAIQLFKHSYKYFRKLHFGIQIPLRFQILLPTWPSVCMENLYICQRLMGDNNKYFWENFSLLESNIMNVWTFKKLLTTYKLFMAFFTGNIYNIPIGIFILDTHPYNPPICYVKPTNTMQIKQGTNVDANGKVDLPYLRDWRYVSIFVSCSIHRNNWHLSSVCLLIHLKVMHLGNTNWIEKLHL